MRIVGLVRTIFNIASYAVILFVLAHVAHHQHRLRRSVSDAVSRNAGCITSIAILFALYYRVASFTTSHKPCG
jgi:predicted permease